MAAMPFARRGVVALDHALARKRNASDAIPSKLVTPAQAGAQQWQLPSRTGKGEGWVPAFAGMTSNNKGQPHHRIASRIVSCEATAMSAAKQPNRRHGASHDEVGARLLQSAPSAGPGITGRAASE